MMACGTEKNTPSHPQNDHRQRWAFALSNEPCPCGADILVCLFNDALNGRLESPLHQKILRIAWERMRPACLNPRAVHCIKERVTPGRACLPPAVIPGASTEPRNE